jgi:hypothetical protein
VVAVANYATNKVSLLKVDASGKLEERVDIPVHAGPVQVSMGDVNGDGVREIVAACIDAQKLDILSLPADLKELDLSRVTVTSSLDVPSNLSDLSEQIIQQVEPENMEKVK